MFTPTVLDHYYTPRNQGRLSDPSGEGVAGSLRTRQYVRMHVRLAEGRVTAARFETWGCVPAVACSSFLTEWALGRTPAEVLAFSPLDLLTALGGIPARRRFCASLAVLALHRAVAQAAPDEAPPELLERRDEP